MSSPGVTFNLTCGKGVTELQNLTNLRLSSFAESHQMQQENFDVSPKTHEDEEKLYTLDRFTHFPRMIFTCVLHITGQELGIVGISP